MIDKARIESAALDIYLKHIKRGSPAKSLAKIIKNEGLWFSEIDSKNKNFLGSIGQIGDSPLHIMVNKNIKPEGRKNFTIAHELGHYVLKHNLHGTSIICSKICEENEIVSDQEEEANYFARCFLLPRERMVKEFTRWFKWKISPYSAVYLHIEPRGQKWRLWKAISGNLKKQFSVSEIVVKIRLVELGLINNF